MSTMSTGFLLILSFVTVAIHENNAYAGSKFQNVLKTNFPTDESSTRYSFTLLGATGDLSKRKIYPALWSLYRDNLLPKDVRIFGYARKQRTVEFLRKNVEPYITVKPEEKQLYDKFWKLNSYIGGTDGGLSDYEIVNKAIEAFENSQKSNRIFYLALPPDVFKTATSNIKTAAMAKHGSTRVVIEKPFGYDFWSSQKLSEHLKRIFTEDQIYRIDHYLGYEMVQNLFALRFGNRLFEAGWNNKNIAAVKIDFAEEIGIEGRGSYFDQTGIIRDVMQNHLLQVFSLIAMERPKSNNTDDIRDAKVQTLYYTMPVVDMNDVVFGQYIANPASNNPKAKVGYRDDPTVPDNSITPTFASVVLRIRNQRWEGVPFIIRAGKGLNKKHTQITIQYKNMSDNLFDIQPIRNELVINLKNPQSFGIKLTSKVPGYSDDLEEITVGYNYDKENNVKIPEPYERLILDIFKGSQVNFVRSDELREAWRIFSQILFIADRFKIQPKEYLFGSSGPKEADELERRYNFYSQNFLKLKDVLSSE